MSNACQTNGAERTDVGPSRPARRPPNSVCLRAFLGTSPYQPDRPDATHNPKVAGSNPAPAIEKARKCGSFCVSGPSLTQPRVRFSVRRPRSAWRKSGNLLQSHTICLSDLRVLAPICGSVRRFCNCDRSGQAVPAEDLDKPGVAGGRSRPAFATGDGGQRAPGRGRCPAAGWVLGGSLLRRGEDDGRPTPDGCARTDRAFRLLIYLGTERIAA